MDFENELIPGVLIKRYKRFFVDIELKNKIITAHCPNPGSMLKLLRKGNAVWITESKNKNRKLKYTLQIIKVDENNIEEARDEIHAVMRRIRGIKPGNKDDFAINQTKAFETQYNALKYAIGGTGIFITILSLVVGGIGIMNIMFVSVKERTREIGVRKAIGATSNMILSQFLMEAITICIIGGVLGLALAFGASFFINKIFPSTLPLWLASGSIIMSVFVGVISGLIPSYQAARLDPIEALRYE